jgi:hypothetical protein
LAAAAAVRAKVAEAKAEQLADEVQKLKAELEKAKEPKKQKTMTAADFWPHVGNQTPVRAFSQRARLLHRLA